MLDPRTIPTLLSGATLASALMFGAASADPGKALDWTGAPETGAIQSFGGDAMSVEPAISEGDGEPAPSPLSGVPAADDDAAMPLASQLTIGPAGALGAVDRNDANEES
ncbi:hypothetical protein [Albimonas pacifica]|uniref:Uncharacterized protein n=1 Tax=Albimonas pacifica TaxID=1114924 RepID=A0A1I3MN92_9RHOB|nr:hypothetical protein [Albimonas pacifica]SFI98439.1 hypothetical protein SAMN05216258_111179 [Albimonas pacifica]